MPDGSGAWDSDDWHGLVLAELDDPANLDADRFAGVLQSNLMDNAAGVRALVRLSAAVAVATTVRLALGEVDPRTHGPATEQSVLQEITLTQPWLSG